MATMNKQARTCEAAGRSTLRVLHGKTTSYLVTEGDIVDVIADFLVPPIVGNAQFSRPPETITHHHFQRLAGKRQATTHNMVSGLLVSPRSRRAMLQTYSATDAVVKLALAN
jgi:DNA-binding transcriptional regulator LsrR (DeoR family)